MQSTINGATIRRTVLEVIQTSSTSGYSLQSGSVLKEVAMQLGFFNQLATEQALLTIWHDLFRSGYLAWGSDIANADPPFFHITEEGHRSLEQLSRDPMNPDGYISYLLSQVSLSPIPRSYIEEALRTYNSSCHKATAVMIGCAAEAVSLELRDILVNKISALGRTPAKDLNDWHIRRVLDALKTELDKQILKMPSDLRESFQAYWPAFTQQIRAARNDAGHPSSIDPVTPETVHASLLIFPELVTLSSRLGKWITISYV